jgi:tRNA(Ile)-lysidine synthase
MPAVSHATTATPLTDAVRACLDRHGVTHSAVLVAVSGGPDSMAMLHGLRGLATERRLALAAVHVNHGLRGAASDEDQRFVEDVCHRWQIPVTVHAADTKAHADANKFGVEEAARRLRYAALRTAAQDGGAAWIATGHTADDQAETVLHHLVRGTGLRGLRGIAERRPTGPDLALIRPLLDVSRAEVLAYLAAHAVSYREDLSNTDRRFTRNRLRHDVLPLLQEHGASDIGAALCRLARQAQEAQELLTDLAERALHEVERPRVGQILVLDAARLAGQPRYLIREVFHLIWEREGWPRRDMSYERWGELVALAHGRPPSADFPGGVHVRRVGKVLQLDPTRLRPSPDPADEGEC